MAGIRHRNRLNGSIPLTRGFSDHPSSKSRSSTNASIRIGIRNRLCRHPARPARVPNASRRESVHPNTRLSYLAPEPTSRSDNRSTYPCVSLAMSMDLDSVSLTVGSSTLPSEEPSVDWQRCVGRTAIVRPGIRLDAAARRQHDSRKHRHDAPDPTCSSHTLVLPSETNDGAETSTSAGSHTHHSWR